jgi:ribosomal protein S18 acetylase RimI-like enzyme
MIDLRPMEEAGFEKFLSFVVESYAQQIADMEGYDIQEARQRSKAQIDGQLAGGLGTPDQLLYKICLLDEQPQKVIGHLWAMAMTPTTWYICDVHIDEKFRGQGYGKAAMRLFEAVLKKKEISRIGLHVFKENDIALKLYKALGYRITGHQMSKKIDE